MNAKKYNFSKVKGLNFRLYDDNDYETAKKWWFDYNKALYPETPILNKDLLPTTGIVITKDNEPIGMGWVHISNSKLGYISWIVTRPKLGPRTRVFAIAEIIRHCEELGKHYGMKYVKILSDKPGLSKLVHASGYVPIKPHDLFVKQMEDDDV